MTAVDRLSLSIRQDEIVAVLGHNGAGKTTTLNMLTGVLAPTTGFASIYNKSIIDEMDEIQQNMGVVQQFEVIFPKLTVREHLELVCDIKNLDAESMSTCIDVTLKDVMLLQD